jgi:hypothetical protein
LPVLSRAVALRWLIFTQLVGCAGAASPVGTPAVTFPPYTGQAAALFDDQIDPKAVGLADVGTRPRTDPVLRARVRAAEAVARVRVATVTADSSIGKPTYRISLDLSGGSFLRRGFPDDHVELLVRADSPAFGTVKWLDTRLIGRTFIGFFHRYAGAEDVELRFHLSSDDPDVAGAVSEAAALGEIAGK